MTDTKPILDHAAPIAAPSDGDVIDRLFQALTEGDLEIAAGCLAKEGRIWHSFDGIAQGKAAALQQWRGLIEAFPERAFVDVRRDRTSRGFVQRHVMVVRSGNGEHKAWPVCIVVEVEGGLVTRLDEYLDRSGFFEPPSTGPIITPGFDRLDEI